MYASVPKVDRCSYKIWSSFLEPSLNRTSVGLEGFSRLVEDGARICNYKQKALAVKKHAVLIFERRGYFLDSQSSFHLGVIESLNQLPVVVGATEAYVPPIGLN